MKQNKIILLIPIMLVLLLNHAARSSDNEIMSKLKIDRDIISSAIEAIKMINKSQLVSINSMTSESMLSYQELLKSLESPDLLKENTLKLNDLMNSCNEAHKIFIHDSKIRIKDNLDLISELKEVYPDIFKASFCADSISRYTDTISAINNIQAENRDIYEIIKMIIISDRTFASDINDFKAIK